MGKIARKTPQERIKQLNRALIRTNQKGWPQAKKQQAQSRIRRLKKIEAKKDHIETIKTILGHYRKKKMNAVSQEQRELIDLDIDFQLNLLSHALRDLKALKAKPAKT